MSNTAICIIALVCLLAWWELLDAVKAIVASRSKAARCSCRGLGGLTRGTVFELPPGAKVGPAAKPVPSVYSYAQRPNEAVSLHLDLDRRARGAGEVN